MRNQLCNHVAVIDGQHYSFAVPVATPGVTQENRAAWGGVSYTQLCTECKATRQVNQNGWQFEYAAWITAGDYVLRRS